MAQIKFNYKEFRSLMSIQFGHELDETSAFILFVLLQQLAISAKAQQAKLGEAADNINASQKTLGPSREHPRSQAFWFGMGRFGLPLLVAIIFSGSYLLYQKHIESEEKLLSKKLEWYERYFSIMNTADPRTTKEFIKTFPYPEE